MIKTGMTPGGELSSKAVQLAALDGLIDDRKLHKKRTILFVKKVAESLNRA